jgi:hypothetical protein
MVKSPTSKDNKQPTIDARLEPTVTAGNDADNSPSQTLKQVNNRNTEAAPDDNNIAIESGLLIPARLT